MVSREPCSSIRMSSPEGVRAVSGGGAEVRSDDEEEEEEVAVVEVADLPVGRFTCMRILDVVKGWKGGDDDDKEGRERKVLLCSKGEK